MRAKIALWLFTLAFGCSLALTHIGKMKPNPGQDSWQVVWYALIAMGVGAVLALSALVVCFLSVFKWRRMRDKSDVWAAILSGLALLTLAAPYLLHPDF
jgi:multisubunit Na+/H+ antiporter MnhB subunit